MALQEGKMRAISEQLEIFGLDEARRMAEAATSPRERSRQLRRVEGHA